MKPILASAVALFLATASQAQPTSPASPYAQPSQNPPPPMTQAQPEHRPAKPGRLYDHPLLGDRSIVTPEQTRDRIALDRGYLPTRDDDRLGAGSAFNEYRR